MKEVTLRSDQGYPIESTEESRLRGRAYTRVFANRDPTSRLAVILNKAL